jgi:hypothetical protein
MKEEHGHLHTCSRETLKSYHKEAEYLRNWMLKRVELDWIQLAEDRFK